MMLFLQSSDDRANPDDIAALRALKATKTEPETNQPG
jgi:hypothetical protein